MAPKKHPAARSWYEDPYRQDVQRSDIQAGKSLTGFATDYYAATEEGQGFNSMMGTLTDRLGVARKRAHETRYKADQRGPHRQAKQQERELESRVSSIQPLGERAKRGIADRFASTLPPMRASAYEQEFGQRLPSGGDGWEGHYEGDGPQVQGSLFHKPDAQHGPPLPSFDSHVPSESFRLQPKQFRDRDLFWGE